MPIREYQAKNSIQTCDYCRVKFETIERITSDLMTSCPRCGAPIKRIISAPIIGKSKSGFDAQAKSSGFHKLKKTGKGEYEKLY